MSNLKKYITNHEDLDHEMLVKVVTEMKKDIVDLEGIIESLQDAKSKISREYNALKGTHSRYMFLIDELRTR